MVNYVKNRGYYDWIMQRFSAVYLLFYFIPIIILIFAKGPDSYFFWKSLFSNLWMKAASVVAVSLIALHAWIGLWTVFTDYIKKKSVRLTVQAIVIAVIVVYVGWGVYAVWLI